MSLERYVADPINKLSGDQVNYTVLGPVHHHASVMILRKVEYPNTNYLSDSQKTMTINVTATGFTPTPNPFPLTITMPSFYVGKTTNGNYFSYYDTLQYINIKLAEALIGVTSVGDMPTALFFSSKGEYVEFNITLSKTTPSVTWATNWTVVFTGDVPTLLGYPSGSYTEKYSSWSSGVRKITTTPRYVQKIQSRHIVLCSRALSKYCERGDPSEAYFLMRLPVDTSTNPGERQIFVPEVPRHFNIMGANMDVVDFYLKTEGGSATYFADDPNTKLIVYFDVYYGDTNEILQIRN